MKDEYDFSKAKKGRVYKDLKVIKTIRLDVDVLVWLQKEAAKEGMGYQTFLNWYLKKAMAQAESFEERLIKLEKAVFLKKNKG